VNSLKRRVKLQIFKFMLCTGVLQYFGINTTSIVKLIKLFYFILITSFVSLLPLVMVNKGCLWNNVQLDHYKSGMESSRQLPRLEAASRQFFNWLGLALASRGLASVWYLIYFLWNFSVMFFIVIDHKARTRNYYIVHCAWYQNDTNNVDFILPRLGLELSASALPRLCLDLSALTSASASIKLPWAHPCYKWSRLYKVSRSVTMSSPLKQAITVKFPKQQGRPQLLCSWCTKRFFLPIFWSTKISQSKFLINRLISR